MKKFIGILIIMLMMFSLVGCGTKEDVVIETTIAPTESTTIAPKLIESTISVQVESSWLEYYNAAAARVKEKYPQVTINMLEVASYDHLDRIEETDITNIEVADVFAFPAERIYGLAQNQVLASMDAKTMTVNVGGFTDYDSGLGGSFNIDGDYLAFPMSIETLINFVNTANANLANLDLTKPIEFTTLNPETILIPVFNTWYGVALTNAAKIELLGRKDDGTLYSDLTQDWSNLPAEKQAVFTALFDYWNDHTDAGTSLWDSSSVWGYMDTSFSSGGKTAIRLDSPWSSGPLSKLADDGADLEILPIGQVTLNGSPLTHWKNGWGLGINARVEDNENQMMLAQTMIEEIMNPDYAIDFFKATGKIMENVVSEVYASSDISEVDKAVTAAVIESYKGSPVKPLFTEWSSVWSTWENSLLSWAIVKPETVQAAYAQVQASFKAMMLNL